MSKHELSFNERQVLEMYQCFYGEPYPANGNPDSHGKAQMMVYLLGLKNVHVGDYGFSWQGGVLNE